MPDRISCDCCTPLYSFCWSEFYLRRYWTQLFLRYLQTKINFPFNCRFLEKFVKIADHAVVKLVSPVDSEVFGKNSFCFYFGFVQCLFWIGYQRWFIIRNQLKFVKWKWVFDRHWWLLSTTTFCRRCNFRLCKIRKIQNKTIFFLNIWHLNCHWYEIMKPLRNETV